MYQRICYVIWNEWTEAAYLSSTNRGDGGIWEDLDEDGETKNTLSFKGTGLKDLNLGCFDYDDEDYGTMELCDCIVNAMIVT
jgi:hypothetical protein